MTYDTTEDNSTELYLKGNASRGPDLVYPEKYHCMTRLKNSLGNEWDLTNATIVMSGGKSGPRTSYLYKWNEKVGLEAGLLYVRERQAETVESEFFLPLFADCL